MKCPVCDLGQLTPTTWVGYFNNGIVVDGLEAHKCDNCDAEPITSAQILRNSQRIMRRKNESNGGLVEGS